MAGYREFQTGEVLTAANVNSFLMEQATMTFADAAARDAALAGVLREGLLTYNLDTNRLEVYDGTDWVEPAPEPPAGIGSNVVSVTKTDRYTESLLNPVGSPSGSRSADIPGFSVTITPSSATSKILLVGVLMGGGSVRLKVFVYRNGSLLSGYLGDPAGDRAQTSANTSIANNQSLDPVPLLYLDSPETTSPVTYTVRVEHGDSTTRLVTINRPQRFDDFDDERLPVSASTLTAIEVAA